MNGKRRKRPSEAFPWARNGRNSRTASTRASSGPWAGRPPRATLQEAVFRARRDPDEAVVSEGDEKEAQRLMNRQEAIEAGILVDVSPIAETVGLRLSVGISRPLWELGISASRQLADDECRGRVRDVLLALRLYIEQHEVKGPWIKFTALLSLPP